MKIKYCFFFCLLLWGLTACIDPYDLESEKDITRLVVEGLITNEPGPYVVKVFNTRVKAFVMPLGDPSAVREAVVTISDDQGNSEILQDSIPGVYKTRKNGIQGQIGHTYTLTVRTKDGKEYLSRPEFLAPTPPIKQFYYEVQKKEALNAYGKLVTENSLQFLLDTDDPGNQRNFYLWKWTGTYLVSTQPWNYQEMDARTGRMVAKPKSCCATCWVKEANQGVNLLEDRLVNNRPIQRRLITEIPVNSQTFGNIHYLEVKQYSLSPAIFDYWTSLKTQLTGQASIQAPPPATIVGNMTNPADNQEKVLGYFGASAVQKSFIYIRPGQLDFNIAPLQYPDDCRNIPFSTIIKPGFW